MPNRARNLYGRAATPTERKRKERAAKRSARIDQVAVLDFETDPFDNQHPSERIRPFAACLYSDDFDPIVIWEENENAFVAAVLRAINGLPGSYTIYAHNGGRFDFMFLIHRLRGEVKFKGRGIMCARVGAHELRDSLHIIPVALADVQKDKFEYEKMHRTRRANFKRDIIDYMINDCRYLLDIVRAFLEKFGFKISIGQAAMAELKRHYTVKKFTENWDTYVRHYFFGGRVECLQGRLHRHGDYRLYDVNSMYPYVMANYEHPIGDATDYNIRPGRPGPKTVFVKLECENHGAFVRRTEDNETTATVERGEFKTSIWEHDVALRYGLIRNVRYLYSVDCSVRTNFSDFVLPLYENRLRTKAALSDLRALGQQGGSAWNDTIKDDTFYKLLLNNAYGKFAQNPRRFKDHYITDPNDYPPDEWLYGKNPKPEALEKPHEHFIEFESDDYWIFSRPNPGFRYNNVGTAASITGAARAVLLEALQHADDAIYCDTDSIIARGLSGVPIDETALGSWKIEERFSEVIICGKKSYACKIAGSTEKIKIRSKGAQGMSWRDFEAMYRGEVIDVRNNAPTLTKHGKQYYLLRRIKATAPLKLAA